MKPFNRVLCLLFLFFSTPLLAAWQSQSFTTGDIEHQIASAGTNQHSSELDLFCDNYDTRISAALYLPAGRFMQREDINISIRVDKKRTWSFTATRHSMAIVVPVVPEQLISQLSRGNRVLLTYPVAKGKTQSEQFLLNKSSITLAKLKNNCQKLSD